MSAVTFCVVVKRNGRFMIVKTPRNRPVVGSYENCKTWLPCYRGARLVRWSIEFKLAGA